MLQIKPSDHPSAAILSTEFSYECQVIQVRHFNIHTVSSSIMVSAISDDTEQTQSMVQNRQVIISDSDNFTPILPLNLKGVSLHSAAAKGDIEAVKFLVQKGGADVVSKDKSQITPLSYAAGNGDPETVKFLVNEAGANITSKDKWGRTALDLARQVIRDGWYGWYGETEEWERRREDAWRRGWRHSWRRKKEAERTAVGEDGGEEGTRDHKSQIQRKP